jgi:hypothetical protein
MKRKRQPAVNIVANKRNGTIFMERMLSDALDCFGAAPFAMTIEA